MRLKFVIIKATQGANIVDKQYYTNWENAQNTNINIGACHFYDLGDDPLQQAENYIKNVKLRKGDLYPIVKIEVNPTKNSNIKKDKVKIVNQFVTFLNQIEEQYGVKPILFTSFHFYNNYLNENLNDYKFMFANFKSKPDPWILQSGTTETQYSSIAFIWQFSFNEKLTGISTNVRMNFIQKEKLDLIVFKK